MTAAEQDMAAANADGLRYFHFHLFHYFRSTVRRLDVVDVVVVTKFTYPRHAYKNLLHLSDQTNESHSILYFWLSVHGFFVVKATLLPH